MAFKPILLKGEGLCVVIFGAGPIGIRKAKAYKRAGASVTLIDRDMNRLSAAKEKVACEGMCMDFASYLKKERHHLMAQHLVVMAFGDGPLGDQIMADIKPYGKLVNRTDAGLKGHYSDMRFESNASYTLAASGNARSPYVASHVLKTALGALNDTSFLKRLKALLGASQSLKTKGIKDEEVMTYTIETLERIAKDEAF